MRQWTSTALATWETTSTVSIGAPSQNHSDGGPGGTRSHAMKQLSAMRTVSGLRSSTQPRPGRTMPRSCRLANLASDVSRFPLANAACTPNGGFSRTVPSTSSIRVSGGSGISKNASAVISCCFTLIVALLCLHLVCMIRHSSLAASTTFRRPANQSLNMLMGESGFGIDRHEERWNRACLRPCPRIGCQYIVDPGQRSMACSTIDGRHLQHRVELASRQLHRTMEVRQVEDIGKQGAFLVGPGASPHQVVVLGKFVEPRSVPVRDTNRLIVFGKKPMLREPFGTWPLIRVQHSVDIDKQQGTFCHLDHGSAELRFAAKSKAAFFLL